MPVTHDVGDFAAFTVATQNLLGVFEGVSYSIEETQVDGSALVRAGASPNGTKLAAKISTTLISTYSGVDRVSHLDTSAFTLGATNYLGVLRMIEMQGSFTQKARAGVGAWFKRPQNTGKDYSFNVELDCDDGVAAAIMLAMHSTVTAARDMAISFTLNGVIVTVPGRMKSAEHGGERDGLQTMKIALMGKDPGAGAFPTSPVGTTTLLEKALNAWKDPVGFTYTSHALAGFTVTGLAIYSSFNFRIEDESLVKNQYSFDSFGTVGAASTAA